MENEVKQNPDVTPEFALQHQLIVFASLCGKWIGTETIYDANNQIEDINSLITSYSFDPIPLKFPGLPLLCDSKVSDFDEYFGEENEEYLNFGNSRYRKITEYPDKKSFQELIGYWHIKYKKVYFINKEKSISGWMGDIRHDAFARTIIEYWEYPEIDNEYCYSFKTITECDDHCSLNSIIYHYRDNKLFKKTIIDQTKELV